ncbi:hypothetical protein H1P_3980006 [Hyella patelloides LEGE 07179]|uniref:Uncharacterized protein n=1 Tax=Hyella patelloides LEGE 07179 TaxID=945734 RepID=A0A563VX55_9CYAN|nr:hypothetical protein H1P_3980006 [Hyella patelloides LEGE 07179]
MTKKVEETHAFQNDLVLNLDSFFVLLLSYLELKSLDDSFECEIR